MVVLAIIIALVIGAVIVSRSSSSKPATIFTDAEKAIVAKLYQEEQAAFAEFKKGKEDVLAEYESLKSRVASLVSLGVKLPAPLVPVVQPVIVSNAGMPHNIVAADPTHVQVPQ